MMIQNGGDESSSGWPLEKIWLRLKTLNVASVAEEVYRLTCRSDYSTLGFCLLTVESVDDSISFRQLMIDLKNAMDSIHESKTGNRLIYLSASRFDQKMTTRPHLDGGPDECFLMLGYEPSNVVSEVAISDYAKCAYDLGITPKAFMDRYNPMFHEGAQLLQPYTLKLACTPSSQYQLLCINNSSAAYSEARQAWQGVLHTATTAAAASTAQRVVNSTMIATVPPGSRDVLSQSELSEFATSSDVGSWN